MGKIKGKRITDEELLNELKRFEKEFGRVPTQKDFENREGYPNRKTFANHFGSFNNALRLAGITPNNLSPKEKQKWLSNEETKKDMLLFLHKWYEDKGKCPTVAELDSGKYKYNRCNFEYVFGKYSNAIKEAGLPLNFTPKYDDEFLHSEFERFIKENGRTPYLHEFNNSDYPSFWCYQNRFGSWNKTFIAYGYKPNDDNRKFYLEDGEICWSSYEFDISKWLKENNIKYERDVKYTDIDKFDYKGKMDCDYKIYINDKIWYVEMAGYLPRKGLPFEKWSSQEKNYFFKIRYKEKLLKRNNLNYLIIPPSWMKEKTLEEIFKDILN